MNIPLFTVYDDFSHQKLESSISEFHQTKVRQELPLNERRFIKHFSEIQLFPQAQLNEAISDLIKHWRWNRVIIVYVEVDSKFKNC